MKFLPLIAIGALPTAWAIYQSLRRRQPFEAAGYFAVWALAAIVLAVSAYNPPRWITDVLVGLAYAVSVPLTWTNLRRRWQDMLGTRPE